MSTVVLTACTGSPESAADDGRLVERPEVETALVPLPTVDDQPTAVSVAPREQAVSSGPTAALIDTGGRLAVVRGGTIGNDWVKFEAFPSADRSTAVMTLGPNIEGIGPDRPVMWASLPEGERLGAQTMPTSSELTATSLDGTFIGLTTRAGAPVDGAIAGTRRVSDIEIISRVNGSVFRRELDGNFVPEAFGSRLNAKGFPALVFLLEYVPADVPRFYRVRVLSTETGEVSLPLNLRDKSEQLDERMAGFTRSQVVAEEHGLLFTLYRGTVDGTPDGEAYAFVHTLDFADGVWCLDVDTRLELDRVPGSLAVGGDRLYVASANGKVGSFPIPSITDPTRSPDMDWVVDAVRPGDEAPLIVADDEAVYVTEPDRPGYVAHVHPEGVLHPAVRMFGGEPTAFDRTDGGLQAVGDEWATFGHVDRPDWLGEIEFLVVD